MRNSGCGIIILCVKVKCLVDICTLFNNGNNSRYHQHCTIQHGYFSLKQTQKAEASPLTTIRASGKLEHEIAGVGALVRVFAGRGCVYRVHLGLVAAAGACSKYKIIFK